MSQNERFLCTSAVAFPMVDAATISERVREAVLDEERVLRACAELLSCARGQTATVLITHVVKRAAGIGSRRMLLPPAYLSAARAHLRAHPVLIDARHRTWVLVEEVTHGRGRLKYYRLL